MYWEDISHIKIDFFYRLMLEIASWPVSGNNYQASECFYEYGIKIPLLVSILHLDVHSIQI